MPGSVLVTPALDTITALGGTVQFSAQLLTVEGVPMSGAQFTWSSTRPSVASVDARTGLATARSKGSSSVTATASGVTGSATLVVSQTPAELLKIDGDGQIGPPGQPLAIELVVSSRDAGGAPVVGYPIVFEVVEGGGTVASTGMTDAAGRASAAWTLGGQGAQRVRARAGPVSADFQATVDMGELAVTTVDLWHPRLSYPYEAQLEATGGDPGSYSWEVTSGTLPPGIALLPSGRMSGTATAVGSFVATVQVTDDQGRTGRRTLQLLVCSAPIDLAPGEVALQAPTGLTGCGLFLPVGSAGDGYRIGVIRTNVGLPGGSDDGDVKNVTLRARGVGSAGQALAPARSAPRKNRAASPVSAANHPESPQAAPESHLAVRAAERLLFSRERASLRVASSVSSPAGSAPDPVEQFFYDPPQDLGACNDHEDRSALLVAANDFLSVYQDGGLAATDPLDVAAVERLLDFYRDWGHDVIADYSGGVPDVNGDGRIVVLAVPEAGGQIAAFVWNGDLFDRETCASSNEMEVIYVSAALVNAMELEDGGFQALGTVVHEAKHVSSLFNRLRFSERTEAPDPFHPTWIEEGTAEIVAEVASRQAWAGTGGPPTTGAVTGEDWVTRGGTPESYHLLLKFDRAFGYLLRQPNAVTANPTRSRFHPYGSGWLFHRFLGDAYFGGMGGGESAFFRQQNDSLSEPGSAAFSSLLGTPLATLLEEYAAGVMLGGTDPSGGTRGSVSYDFESISSVLSEPWEGVYPFPVTWTGAGDGIVDFSGGEWQGPAGESGLRVHEFRSDGTGLGMEVHVEVPGPARVVVVRLNSR